VVGNCGPMVEEGRGPLTITRHGTSNGLSAFLSRAFLPIFRSSGLRFSIVSAHALPGFSGITGHITEGGLGLRVFDRSLQRRDVVLMKIGEG